VIIPLLGKDLETSNEKTAVAMQRHCKRVFTTKELLLVTVFLLGPCKGVIRKTFWATVT
jgi:hypothetical protein